MWQTSAVSGQSTKSVFPTIGVARPFLRDGDWWFIGAFFFCDSCGLISRRRMLYVLRYFRLRSAKSAYTKGLGSYQRFCISWSYATTSPCSISVLTGIKAPRWACVFGTRCGAIQRRRERRLQHYSPQLFHSYSPQLWVMVSDDYNDTSYDSTSDHYNGSISPGWNASARFLYKVMSRGTISAIPVDLLSERLIQHIILKSPWHCVIVVIVSDSNLGHWVSLKLF